MRLLIAVSVFRLILLRTCLLKHAVIEPRLAGRRLLDDEIHAALLLIVLFAAVVIEKLARQEQPLKEVENLLPLVSGTPSSEKQTIDPKP